MNLYRQLNNLICTVYIFGVLYLLSLIPAQFELLDPLGEALKDFELTDIVFSEIREEQTADTNIVLVNIGYLNRSQIGRMLGVISESEPAVVGIDAFFRKKKDFEQDIQLIMGMSQVENLVLVNEVTHPVPQSDCFDSLSFSHAQFNNFASNGFANVLTGGDDGFRSVRRFSPAACVGDSSILSFPSKVVSLYDSASFEQLMSRKITYETINWRGNYKKFYHLDYSQVLEREFDPGMLKGKIVLLGFIGPTLGKMSLDDSFFTPLNPIPAGRTDPDMYGITVHANVISQILNGNYINSLTGSWNLVLAFVLVFLNVSLFMWVGSNYKVYYDLITKVLILFEVSLLFAVNLLTLLKFNLKVDLTVAILAIIFSGDLTELYVGSLKDLAIKFYQKIRRKPVT